MAILTQNTYDPTLYDHIQKPYVPTSENDYLDNALNTPSSTESSFSRAIARGTDQYQASLYGFAKTIGDATGIDMLSKFGEEGVESNIKEIMANPADIRDWDDVDSLAEFGTYFVEALGEQVPQLAVDIPLLVGGTVAGTSMVGARKVAMAQVGKTVKRKLGQKAFLNFKRLAVAAPTANLMAQSIGETQMELMAEDVEAPGTAIATGAVKGLIDRVGLGYIVDKALKVGVSPNKLVNTTKQLLAAAGSGMAVEGATEAAQTALDKVALKYELGDEFDLTSQAVLDEIIESSIKGGLVGGTLSSGARGISLYHEYTQALKNKSDQSITALVEAMDQGRVLDGPPEGEAPDEGTQFENDAPIPEPQTQIDAQYAALLNPESAKKVMEITEGSPLPSTEIDKDTLAVHTKNGLALTQDRAIADLILKSGGDQNTMGELLYGNANGKSDTDGTVVIGRDTNGEIVYEEGTSPARITESIARARENAPGGRIEVTDVETAVQERINKLNQLPYEGVLYQAAQNEPDAQGKSDEFVQGALDDMFTRLDPKIRQAILDGLQGDQQLELANAIVRTALKEASAPRQNERKQNENLRKEFGTKSPSDREVLEKDDVLDKDKLIGEESVSEAAGKQFTSARWAPVKRKDGTVRRFQTEKSTASFIRNQEDPSAYRSERYWDDGARNYRFRVEQRIADENTDKGRKTATTLVDDAIHAAEQSAKKRRGFLKGKRVDPHVKQNAQDSLITLEHQYTGETKKVAAMDLTQAGKTLLNESQISERSADGEYDATAFNHMLAQLAEKGWNAKGITDDTLISHGNLKDRSPGLRIKDVREGMRKQRKDLHKLEYLERSEHPDNSKKKDAIITKQKSLLNTESDLAKAKDSDPDTFTDTVKDPEREKALEAKKERQTPRKTDENGEKITYSKSKPKAALSWTTVKTKLRRKVQRSEGYSMVNQRVRLAGKTLGKSEADFITHILAKTKLALDITVLESDSATIDAAVAQGIISAIDRQAINDMAGKKRGMYIANGKEAIIIVPPLKLGTQDEQAKRLWVLGHEMGHGILDASLDTLTPKSRGRLERMYQRAKPKSKAYQGPNGFAEWFADRVANFARDSLSSKKVDPTFAETASKLRALFATIKAYIKNARMRSNKTFNTFMEDMAEQGVFSKATMFGFGPRQYMTDDERARIRRNVADRFKHAKRKVLPFFTHNWGKHVLRPVVTGDGELRMMGDVGRKIADMFYWPFDTTKRSSKTAYFSQVDIAMRRYVGSLQKALRLNEGQTSFTKAELKEAFDQLSQERPDSELNEAALAIRNFLEHFHERFIQPTMPLVGYERNYFPRIYEREAIEANREQFIEILERHGVTDAQAVVSNILGENSDMGNIDFQGAVPPTGRLAKSRALRNPDLIKELVQAEFLNPNPVETLFKYTFAAVQRGVWENSFAGYRYIPGAKLEKTLDRLESAGHSDYATRLREEKQEIIDEFLAKHNLTSVDHAIEWSYMRRDEDGELQMYDPNKEISETIAKGRKTHNYIQEAEQTLSQASTPRARQRAQANLDAIKAQYGPDALTPEQAQRVQKIIRGYTGKLGMEMNQTLNSAQSTAMMLANWTMLGLSTISSLVEPALLFKSVKDAESSWMAFRGIVKAVKDRKELMALYGDLGLMESHLQMEVMSQLYGYHNANSFAKKGNDILFKINAQVWFTNTSRLAGAHTAVMFIKDHATKAAQGNADSLRYLKEIGIDDPSVVEQWVANGEQWWTIENNDRNARIVQDAVTRFVQSAVLTPNRAERPVWGNDIRYALLWHLKSFAYTFQKNAVNGLYTESRRRYTEGGLTPAMAYLVPITGVFLAFAAMANELREEIQYRLGGGYRPSNFMDTGEYLNHLLQNRIGVGATITPWFDAVNNSWGRSFGALSLSPVAGKLDQLITSPDYIEGIMDATPFLAQNPGAQRFVRRALAPEEA